MNKTPLHQPCSPRGLEEGLRDLRGYAARVKQAAAQRLREVATLRSHIDEQRQREKTELEALLAAYFPGDGTGLERLERCIAVLEGVLRNPALSGGPWDTSQCVHGEGPCPPQTEPAAEQAEQTGSQGGGPPEADSGSGRRYRSRGYYDAHRKEILADLKALGYNRTLAKWDLTSATLVTLRRRWGEAPPKGKGGGQGG